MGTQAVMSMTGTQAVMSMTGTQAVMSMIFVLTKKRKQHISNDLSGENKRVTGES